MYTYTKIRNAVGARGAVTRATTAAAAATAVAAVRQVPCLHMVMAKPVALAVVDRLVSRRH